MEKNLILTKAKGAVLSHDFATAARLYKMLLSEDASNVEYLKQLGSIYVQNQEDEKAIPYYEQIITFYPHYIEAMNSLGAIYRRLGRYEESVAILQRAVDEGRDAASVNYNLGFTYKEMGNYKDAIDAFNLVIHENPDDVLAYNHLGRIHFDQKNYEKAIASYKRGLQIDQNHPILNYNLAHCYEATKATGDAIRCYQSALKTRPGWVDAINDFSELLIKCQKNKEAQDLVQQSIKLHPTNADLLCLLGRVYLNQYDYSSAEKTFWKADSYKSNDVKILTGLSEALEKGEKVDAALETVLGALEIEPENKDIRKQYVHTLLTAKDYDTALANVQDLYDETEGKDVSILDLYGQYYICKDQEEKAQEYYNKIKTQNHHYKDYMLGAANRYAQIGKLDKAESYANEFIERRPSNPEGYNVLGKIFENKGDLQKAIDSYNKSLNLRKPNVLADKKIAKFKDELVKQDIPVEEPVQTFEPVEETPAVVEAPAVETEEKAEEEFDYSLMGGNVPLQEGLVEEEKDFFDSLDEDRDDFPEEEEKKPEEDNEDETPKFKYNSGEPSDVFGDDGIFDDDAAKKENDSLENGLKDATDDYNKSSGGNDDTEDSASSGTEDLASSLSDAADDDFDIFGDEQPYRSEPEPEPVPQPQAPAAPAPKAEEPAPAAYEPPVQPQPAYNPQQEELERRMQQMAMDNAAHAMEAAFAAQKMAQQLADQQKIMQEQTQQALQEALDKVQNLQEERMKEQDRAIESLLDDDNIVDETPVVETEDFPVEEAVEEPVEEVVEEPAEEIIEDAAEESIPEDDFDLDLGEDSAEEETSLDDLLLEDETEEEPVDEIAEDIIEEETPVEEVTDEPVEEVIQEEIPEDDFDLDLDVSPDYEEQQEILAEQLSMEGSIEDADEMLFASADDLLQQLGELPQEIIEEEPVEEEVIAETSDTEPVESVDDMLAKIERILSDDEMAKEYGPQLELFKKLKVLSDYLPESEKNTFLSCRMRMLIEYIIHKMSGKPGLLSTAVALIKSGVLGSEYEEKLVEDVESDGEVRNELIRIVLLDMKKMTQQLQDRTLADAMVASVDNILERIEIEDQKSKIF